MKQLSFWISLFYIYSSVTYLAKVLMASWLVTFTREGKQFKAVAFSKVEAEAYNSMSCN